MTPPRGIALRCVALALLGLFAATSSISRAEDAGYRQYAPGLLARTVYTTRDRVAVEIWDLMLGPGRVAPKVELPGAAVLEVRTGAGTVEHEGGRRELHTGSTVTVPGHSSFGLANASSEQSFVLRAVIIRPVSP